MKAFTPVTVHELRACQLCTQHTAGIAGLCCTHPLVVHQAGGPTLCATARRPDGLCGPDARHQHWPHLDRELQRRVVLPPLPLYAPQVAA